jgi:hypothetical protein
MQLINNIINAGSVPRISSGDTLPDPSIIPLIDNEIFLRTTDNLIFVSVSGAWVQFAPTAPIFPLAYPQFKVTGPTIYNIDPSADYTILFDASIAGVNVVNLPDSGSTVATGQRFDIKVIATNAVNTITIQVHAGLIDGLPSYTLPASSREAVTVQYDGVANYNIISKF